MIAIPTPPSELLERLIALAAILLVVGAGTLMYYIHQDASLTRLENHFRREFILFQPYGKETLELPALRMRDLRDNGEANIHDFKDKFVLLNLWATWCTPCLAELPAMQQLKKHYAGKGLNIVAVSIESDRPPQQLVSFLRRNRIGDVAYYQDHHSDFQKALIFNALPTTYLIDPDGRILYQMTGTTDWYAPEMIKFLDAALKVY